VSADYWLVIDTGGKEPAMLTDGIQVTYNLGLMLRAAGFPDWEALRGAPASEVGGMLRSVADRLRADPERFKAMNPPNGWGSYEVAIGFLDRFAGACAEHPRAFVEAWL
jgi:hypothetical protein